jgi:glucokinase
MEIIAGDIGGTHSRLAWVGGGDPAAARVRFERSYASADFSDGVSLLRRFMADAGQPRPPDRLLLALPGPGDAARVTLTNLDWALDARQLGAALGIGAVRFVNDFEAAAHGVAWLSVHDVVALNPRPVRAGGVRAVTGAGTGLGLAWLVSGADGRYRAFASEGGHADFAPGDEDGVRLLAWLRRQWGHVSWERVVSGPGLGAIDGFLRAADDAAPRDGAAVARAADAGDAVAQRAIDLFIGAYGAWVGNVALTFRPTGGLYIAGGVALRLRRHMESARFMAACLAKGRMRGVVEETPIFLVTSERLGLLGAIASAFDD